MNRHDGNDAKLDPTSLVGSYFHGDAVRQWQGVVVAEPRPGVYLVEVFDWLTGGAYSQCLIRLDDMIDNAWSFYDTAQWMRDCVGDAQRRWSREPEAVAP